MISIKKSDNHYFLKNLNMDIYEFSFASLDTEWKYKDALSGSTRIYFPTLGEGFLDTATESISIVPGYIYIIPSMFNLSYRCENRLDKFYSQLTLETGDGFDALQTVNKILVIKDEGECARLENLFKNKALEAAIEIKRILLEVILRALKIHAITLGTPKKTSQITAKALDYINANLSAKLKVNEIAEALLVSRASLSITFTKDMNISIGKYIDEKLMFAAERDLTVHGLSINEVSDKYAFCDRFYFTRRFTEKFGRSPTKYLKSNRYPTK